MLFSCDPAEGFFGCEP